MRKMIIFFLTLFLMGCSYGEKLLNEPEAIIKDPHYAQYQEKLDALEKSYLQKEITYAQYLEKKQQLDDIYTKEVRERTEVIYGDK